MPMLPLKRAAVALVWGLAAELAWGLAVAPGLRAAGHDVAPLKVYVTAAQVEALIRRHTQVAAPDVETLTKAAEDARNRERLDRMLAREASRRSPRGA